MLINKGHHRFHDFANRLVELKFPRVLRDDLVHELIGSGGIAVTGVNRHGCTPWSESSEVSVGYFRAKSFGASLRRVGPTGRWAQDAVAGAGFPADRATWTQPCARGCPQGVPNVTLTAARIQATLPLYWKFISATHCRYVSCLTLELARLIVSCSATCPVRDWRRSSGGVTGKRERAGLSQGEVHGH